MQSGTLRISWLKITHESRAHPVGDTLMSAWSSPSIVFKVDTLTEERRPKHEFSGQDMCNTSLIPPGPGDSAKYTKIIVICYLVY